MSIPFVSIRRPAIISKGDLLEQQRWQKHTLDNIDLLNTTLGPLRFSEFTATVTSGVEAAVPNPFSTGKPAGISIWSATDSTGSAVSVASAKLNLARTDDALGITVTQDLLGGTGDIGERISDFVTNSSPVNLITVTPTNIVSVTLGQGVWDLDLLLLTTGSPSGLLWDAAINTVSATLPAGTEVGDTRVQTPVLPTTASDSPLVIPRMRTSPNMSTTYYGIAQARFSGGSIAAYGRLTATRAQRIQNSITVTGVLWAGA